MPSQKIAANILYDVGLRRLLFAALAGILMKPQMLPSPCISRRKTKTATETRPEKPQTLFLFRLSPVERLLLQFSNFIADALQGRRACPEDLTCLSPASVYGWLQQQTVHSRQPKTK